MEKKTLNLDFVDLGKLKSNSEVSLMPCPCAESKQQYRRVTYRGHGGFGGPSSGPGSGLYGASNNGSSHPGNRTIASVALGGAVGGSVKGGLQGALVGGSVAAAATCSTTGCHDGKGNSDSGGGGGK